MSSDTSKYNQFTNLFCNLKSSSSGRERQKQWLDALGNPTCESCAQDPTKRICDVERVACKGCKDRHRSCPRFIKFMMETITADLGISNETYEKYRVNFTRKGGGGAAPSTRKSSSRKAKERKVKDRERRSARSASMAAAKNQQNGQPVAGTSASASAGPLHVPGFESDLESLSDLDDEEDDHPPSSSAAIPSTSRAPNNIKLPPSRTPNSHLTLEGWSQLCLSMSASLDNVSRTKSSVPPTPSSGAVVTRNRSSTAQELAGPGVKRPSFLPPPPPRTTGSTPVNGAVDLKRRVQELESTLKERDRALKKQHEDRVRGDARARLLEGQLRDSDKRLEECTARLNEGGIEERDALLKEREARVQELDQLLKERDTRLEELESRVEGLHARLQDPSAKGEDRLRERDARIEELEQRRDSWISEERDKLSARIKEREQRLKERDARILEQDVQIQDLTNRLSERREDENRMLDARRVEDLERRLRIQEQLRIQEERMRIEEGRLYRVRVDELEGMVRKRGEGTLMCEVGIQVDDQPHEELDDREKDIGSREQECAQREVEVRDREKGVKERERGVKEREKDMREKEREFREREKETREKEKERREREKGVGRLDMGRYTPVALDEDGERELRELKDEMDALKSSRFRQTILTHGVQVLLLKLLSDLETNSSDMGRSRVQRRLSEIQKQLGSVMIAGVETDMERSEYMERLDAVAVVNGGTARGESASTGGGGGKRKRRAVAEGEAEGEEGSRRSGKKAKGGQSSSSSLNLPFGV